MQKYKTNLHAQLHGPGWLNSTSWEISNIKKKMKALVKAIKIYITDNIWGLGVNLDFRTLIYNITIPYNTNSFKNINYNIYIENSTSTEEKLALKQIAINFSNREQPQNWFFSHSVGCELKQNQELLPHCSTASGHWSLLLSLPKTLSASRIWEQEAPHCWSQAQSIQWI